MTSLTAGLIAVRNVLVASMTTRQVAEIDRTGATRWSATCTGRPWSVHYR